MASSLYRRHSMAQLYEKLRAQDDDDDLAWLAQYSPDDKSDEPYVPPVPSPPSLSTISSASPTSSCSSGPSFSDPGFDNESSDGLFDSDSGSDADPEPLSLDTLYAEFDPSCSPLIFQPDNFPNVAACVDTPYVPSTQETSSPPSISTPLSDEFVPFPMSSLPASSLAVDSHRTARSTRSSITKGHLTVFHDPGEDAYSESDGNGSEDEYFPSPISGSRKRYRCTRATTGPTDTSSHKRIADHSPHKRPRHSPHPRNAQAAPGTSPVTSATKSNPWACPYCRWVQRNHRIPDLKRHIRTHTRLQRPAQWVCCGISMKDADDYAVPAGSKPYVWRGEMMIGGCCKEFSRRDALKRHLDNDHISCVGNFAAFASICEDDS